MFQKAVQIIFNACIFFFFKSSRQASKQTNKNQVNKQNQKSVGGHDQQMLPT